MSLTLFEMSAIAAMMMMMMMMVVMMLDVYLMSTWINLALHHRSCRKCLLLQGPKQVVLWYCQNESLALSSVCSLRFLESTP